MGTRIKVKGIIFEKSLLRKLPLDKNPSPTWALSAARLLSIDYDGPLMRIRRSQDNDELDIYANDTGFLDSDAIAAFISTGSAYVVRLYNQAGGGYFGQIDASKQPSIAAGGVLHTENNLASMKVPAGRFLRAYTNDENIASPFSSVGTMAASIVHKYLDAPVQFARVLFTSIDGGLTHKFSVRASSSNQLGFSARPCSEYAAENTINSVVSVNELVQTTAEIHLDTKILKISKNGEAVNSSTELNSLCSLSDTHIGSVTEIGHSEPSTGAGGIDQMVSEVILFETNDSADIREIENDQLNTFLDT